jgi:PKD repeat protein
MVRSIRTLTAVLAAAALGVAGCTVHKQDEAPPLTGPSETAVSLSVTVSPDVLAQDGQSQSLVTIQAFGPNGQPQRSLPLRAEIGVGGAFTDFGTLSARNLVTDANGRAQVTYTAPPSPPFNNDLGITVQIFVTPVGTNYVNANPRNATIRLVPSTVVGPPLSSLRPEFAAPAATVGNPAVFTATVTDSAGADATGQVVQYFWDFGDGGTGVGRSTSHTFDGPGTFAVQLVIVDVLGRAAQVTHSMTIGQGQIPTATFLFSPTAPNIEQTINFNASGSQAEPGHVITDFSWNFGDGTLGSGALTTHVYHNTGTYVVTLKVTDDAGRKSTLATQSVTVGNGNPTADFNFNPSAPRSNQQVAFDASPSQAASGRTIVSYSWAFGDGGSGTGQSIIHTYTLPPGSTTAQTFNVLLTVTDSAGKTGSITKPITINP